MSILRYYTWYISSYMLMQVLSTVRYSKGTVYIYTVRYSCRSTQYCTLVNTGTCTTVAVHGPGRNLYSPTAVTNFLANTNFELVATMDDM